MVSRSPLEVLRSRTVLALTASVPQEQRILAVPVEAVESWLAGNTLVVQKVEEACRLTALRERQAHCRLGLEGTPLGKATWTENDCCC